MAEPATDHAPPVQPQAYDEAGRPIAAEDTARAIAEGKAFFQPGAKVYVKENGVFGTVDAEDATTALTPGELHHEHVQRTYGKGAGNTAKALAYGAARGLTLSASDILAAKLGGRETAEEIEGLREAQPVASIGGEIAGAAAPLLLSGGASAAASAANMAKGAATAGKLARGAALASDAVRTVGWAPRLASRAGSLVERGIERGLETLGYEGTTAAGRILAKTAAGAAGGAAEAAIYGAGHGAAEQVLAGDDISAEKILATMGHEALWGAGIGGVLAGGSAALGEGVRLVAKRGVSQELGDFATERGLKAVGRDTEKMFRDLSPEQRAVKRHAVGEDLFYKIQKGEFQGQRVIDAAESPEQILAKLRAAKNENGAALGGLKDELNAKMLERPDLGPKLEELQKLRNDMAAEFRASGTRGNMSNARRVESEFNALIKKHEPVIDPQTLAVSHTPPPPTFLEVDNFRRALDADLNPKGVPMAMRAIAVGEKAQALDKVTRGLSDYLKDKASTALQTLGEDAGAYSELSRKYASFLALEKVADKTVSSMAKNRTVSPSDHGLGMMGFLGALITGNVGALGAMGVGAAATIANKLARERGNSLLASWARDASQVDSTVQAAAKALAGAKAVTRREADAGGLGGGLRRIGEKAKVATATTANNALPAIELEGPTGGNKHVPRMEPGSLQERYSKTAERVRELNVAESAQDHMARIVAEAAPAHPDLAVALSGKMAQTYQYLHGKLPKSSTDIGTTLTPLAIKERVSPADMRSFLAAADGALDPMGVIDSLAQGQPPAREALDAMKVVYPQLYQQLRGQVAEELSQSPKELPTKRRVMVSITFDLVGDSSLEPARFAGLQEAAKTLSVQDAAKDQAAVKPLEAKPGNPGVSKLGKSMTPPMDAAFAGDTT